MIQVAKTQFRPNVLLVFMLILCSAALSKASTVATPTFSPVAGTYSNNQTVTINDSTSGATIYYTTNGTTPTTSSSVYSSPIAVSASETIKAIGVKSGFTNSIVGSATYTLTVATPTFSPAAGTYSSAQTVTISDSTSGATIYYTTNGSTPTTSSSVYTGPITVSASETIKAIGAKSGYSNSGVGSAIYTLTVATPTFSPTAGTYNNSQTVTISDSTSGATIHYTTNGTTPTTSSPVYSGPITVSASETIKALGAESGYSNSSVGSATYTLTVATPTFSPSAGTYTSPQTVTISDATSGATIHYTTNGTTPTTSSPVYSAPIAFSSTETIKALAVLTGFTNSAIGSAAYTINLTVATPTFTPAAGTYTSTQTVAISVSTPGATIHYTTNGTTPTTSSPVYSAPITVSSTETVEALGTETGYAQSAIGSATYTITPPAAMPTFSPAAGTYTSTQTVTISDATTGATIYYTTNGSTPTTSSSVYSAPITVSASETIKAIATASGYSQSAVGSAAYTITPPAATPTFSPAAGAYTSTQTVAISDSTSGATMYYTTNGSTPTTGSPVYSGPITVSTSETIKAIATATGYSQSGVGSAAYTITPPAATPTFSPAAGTYTSTQTVTISDSTTGATIYYTTNGTTPTTSSSVYSAPISVSSTETVEAIATASGYSQSAVGSAAYTITPPAATPTLSPAAGTYTSTQTVAISDSTSGATIYYTTNGTTPTTGSPVYSGAITVSSTETVEAIATASGYSQSAVGSAAYTITPPAATPTFSPAAGTYTSAQTVTISDSTSGATIYYTTDGATPTTSSSVYSAPISVSSTETLQAIATASGYSQSAVATAAYTITAVAATPTFSPAAGSYTSTQSVTLSDSTTGATIYYTTDGTTPTTSSATYSDPIAVSSSETIQAIATASGYTQSQVGSAAYTISSSSSPWTHVQGSSAASASQGTSLTLTLPTNPGAGNNVVVAVEFGSSSSVSGVTVADGSGNSYQMSPSSPFLLPGGSNASSIYLFYLLNAPSNASQTLTVNWTTAAGAAAWADEFSSSTGTATFDVDLGATNTFSGTAINFPYLTPAGSNELLYAVGFPASSLSAPAAGASAGPWVGASGGLNTTVTNGAVEYDLGASAATSPNFTDAISGDTVRVAMLAISPASAISSGPSVCGNLSQTGADSGHANYGLGTPCVTGSNGGGYTVSSISYWVGSPVSTSFDLGIYSDSSGSPAALLCSVSTGTITPSAGWNSINISGCPTLNAATTYWMGYITASNPIQQGTIPGACPGTSLNSFWATSAQTSATLPASFGASAAGNSCYSMYMTLNPVPAAVPRFFPPSGTYPGSINAVITDPTPNAVIYYTTDGSTPTTNSNQCSNNCLVTINATTTLEAMAIAPGFVQSATSSAIYTMTSAVPTITGISPVTGSVGTSVTVSGMNLETSGTITFNGVQATPSTWGIDTVTVPVPTGATTGPIVITNDLGTSNSVNFAVVATISGVAPTVGNAGTSVVLSGSGFGTTQGSSVITFNGVPATPSNWSNSSITVAVPAGATSGIVALQIGGTSINGPFFTLAPRIASLSPTAGPIGTIVTIAGSNFGPTASGSLVMFGGVTASPSQWSQNSIVVPAPVGAMNGSVVVTVGGVASNAVPFTVAATVTGSINGTVTQADGVTPIAGATVTVFEGANSVISAVTASDGTYTVPNLLAATYNLQASASGFGTGSQSGVTVQSGQATTANITLSTQRTISYTYDKNGRLTTVADSATGSATYSYDAVGNILSIARAGTAQVSILGFSPTSGPVGTQVTVSGTGFSTIPSQNTVTIGGVNASVVSGTPTQLIIQVPTGASTGPIGITNSNGSASSSSSFTVTSSGSQGGPSITSFTPGIANAGATITISGANFDPAPENDLVEFNGSLASVVSASPTSISVMVPNATSGPITVETPAGQSAPSADFIVVPSGSTPSQVDFTGELTVGTSFTGTINTQGHFGIVLFHANAGDQINLVITDSTLNAYVSVLQPNGSTLAYQYSYTGSIFNGRIPESGSYAIVIPKASVGSITLALATTITSSVTPGTPISIGNSSPTQIPAFTFQGGAGQLASIQLSDSSCSNGGGARVTLISPDGTALGSTSGQTCPSFFLAPIALPSAGTYTVVINPVGTVTTLEVFLFDPPTPAPISPGNPVGVTIDTPGKNALLSFSGTAGQYATVQLSNSSFFADIPITILGPNGSTLVSTFSAYLNPISLPANGNYTIIVAPTGGTTGSVTASLSLSEQQGNVLTPGTSVSVTVTSPAQYAKFLVNGVAGQFLTATLADSTFPDQPYFSIVGPEGGALASVRDNTVGPTQLPANLTYGVQIYSFGETGSGTLTVSLSAVQSNGPISPGSVVPFVISTPGQSDQFSFNGTAGQLVSALVPKSPFPGHELIAISNPDGSTLISTNSNSAPDFIGPTPLPVTGTYTLTVSPLYEASGVANIGLWLFANQTGLSISPQNPTPVNIGIPGQNVQMSFTGAAGQTAAVQLSNITFASNLAISIINPDGTTLASNYFASTLLEAYELNPVTLPVTGTYTLLIAPQNGATGGATVNLSMR